MTLKSYRLVFEKDFIRINKGLVLKRSVDIKLSDLSSLRITRRPLNVFTKSTKLCFYCESYSLKKEAFWFTLKKEDAESLIEMYKKASPSNNINGEVLW